MTAICAVQDSAGPSCKLAVTVDPDKTLRQFRACNARVTGFAMLLWCGPNEVVARRVKDAAQAALEKAGYGRDGGWLGCYPWKLERAVRGAASLERGAVLMTSEERLTAAAEALGRKVTR